MDANQMPAHMDNEENDGYVYLLGLLILILFIIAICLIIVIILNQKKESENKSKTFLEGLKFWLLRTKQKKLEHHLAIDQKPNQQEPFRRPTFMT